MTTQQAHLSETLADAPPGKLAAGRGVGLQVKHPRVGLLDDLDAFHEVGKVGDNPAIKVEVVST